MASGTIKAVASKADVHAIQTQIDNLVPSKLISFTGLGSTITLPSSSRHLLILSGAGIARFVMILVNVSTTGAIQIQEIFKGDNTTITFSDNTIVYRIAGSTASTIKVTDFAMQGNTVTATVIES